MKTVRVQHRFQHASIVTLGGRVQIQILNLSCLNQTSREKWEIFVALSVLKASTLLWISLLSQVNFMKQKHKVKSATSATELALIVLEVQKTTVPNVQRDIILNLVMQSLK